ncbi:MAG: hypothetical protein J5676_13615 [Bacteroidaceae bacterium]|nr:hypothetical protein [Bacteroidaceae bacterium]
MITRHNIETAYSFFHQKLRVYQYSNLDWQKDDIEYAISSYIEDMDKELYAEISDGTPNFLLDHTRFSEDMAKAVGTMEKMLGL